MQGFTSRSHLLLDAVAATSGQSHTLLDLTRGRGIASAEPDAVRRRVQLHRAIARGELERGLCLSGSGHGPAIAHFTAPATATEPFAGLAWICRRCRHEFVEGERIAAAAAAADRKALEARRLQALRLETALALVVTIPRCELERLERLAARGPAGITLRPQSPLFQQRLAVLVEEYRSGRDVRNTPPPTSQDS